MNEHDANETCACHAWQGVPNWQLCKHCAAGHPCARCDAVSEVPTPSVNVTDEGVIIDWFDANGELVATFGRTFDELLDEVTS